MKEHCDSCTTDECCSVNHKYLIAILLLLLGLIPGIIYIMYIYKNDDCLDCEIKTIDEI